MNFRHLFFITLLAFGVNACIYRIEVDQGNVVSGQQLKQLRPGMSKEDVRQILGDPLLADIFHDSRWDYVQYYKSGKTQKEQKGNVSLHFTNGLLTAVQADSYTDIQTESLPYGIEYPEDAEKKILIDRGKTAEQPQ